MPTPHPRLPSAMSWIPPRPIRPLSPSVPQTPPPALGPCPIVVHSPSAPSPFARRLYSFLLAVLGTVLSQAELNKLDVVISLKLNQLYCMDNAVDSQGSGGGVEGGEDEDKPRYLTYLLSWEVVKSLPACRAHAFTRNSIASSYTPVMASPPCPRPLLRYHRQWGVTSLRVRPKTVLTQQKRLIGCTCEIMVVLQQSGRHAVHAQQHV